MMIACPLMIVIITVDSQLNEWLREETDWGGPARASSSLFYTQFYWKSHFYWQSCPPAHMTTDIYLQLVDQ